MAQMERTAAATSQVEAEEEDVGGPMLIAKLEVGTRVQGVFIFLSFWCDSGVPLECTFAIIVVRK